MYDDNVLSFLDLMDVSLALMLDFDTIGMSVETEGDIAGATVVVAMATAGRLLP
jgi:hypothetical protein